ncbi:hypothetical protein Tco_0793220 [Tanacetum coccineum]
MEREVTNDNQIARKLLDVVKDVDKSLIKRQGFIDELKVKKGEKVKCGSNGEVEEEGFRLNNGADETKEEEGVIMDCGKENVTGEDFVNENIQEDKSVDLHDEKVLPNLNNACNTIGGIGSSNMIKSYANVHYNRKNECDKNLKVIPTKIEENGNEIKLSNVPLEAWTTNGISALASRIGKPMVMDAVTTTIYKIRVGRDEYARVLVEVSANKELPKHVEIMYKNRQNKDFA